MSVSKRFVNDPGNVQTVLTMYLESPDKPTMDEIASALGVARQSVQVILEQHVDGERLKVEKALRYSRSKVLQNPMRGKNGDQHHNYKGLIGDGHGYLMRKVDGKYVLEHRRVFALALGMEELPPWLEIHHIDGDKTNNHLDNLALVTAAGHGKLHADLPRSQRLTMWDRWEYGTLKLPITTRTRLRGS